MKATESCTIWVRASGSTTSRATYCGRACSAAISTSSPVTGADLESDDLRPAIKNSSDYDDRHQKQARRR